LKRAKEVRAFHAAEDADPELQPLVSQARERMGRIMERRG
jgi:hypothetical protein